MRRTHLEAIEIQKYRFNEELFRFVSGASWISDADGGEEQIHVNRRVIANLLSNQE